MHILFESVELALQTRKESAIRNELLRRAPSPGQVQEAFDYRKKFPGCKHRNTKPSLSYNCHGLTFAARRTAIIESASIQSILKDDGYIEVDRQDVVAGDIVMYYEFGDFSHSGIVVEVDHIGTEPVIWILSKWAHAHEVIHRLYDCPYWGRPDINIRFWRIEQ
jgi:hypothetical protein